jgi:hypothetical protein
MSGISAEPLYELVAHDSCGILRGGMEKVAFEGLQVLNEMKSNTSKYPGHSTFYSALLRHGENLAYVSVLDQDHLLAVGHRPILAKIADGLRVAYAESYEPDAREIGKADAQKLVLDIKPLSAFNDNFDFLSFWYVE